MASSSEPGDLTVRGRPLGAGRDPPLERLLRGRLAGLGTPGPLVRRDALQEALDLFADNRLVLRIDVHTTAQVACDDLPDRPALPKLGGKKNYTFIPI